MALVRAVVLAWRWVRRPVFFSFGWLLLAPAAALAVSAAPHLVLQSNQVWVALIGSLTPLVGYVLNHFAPWLGEPVKAAVQVVLAAAASAVYTAIATSVIGWNTATFELIGSGVVAALIAHKALWLPSGISTLLGGGSNAQHRAAKRVKPVV